jgi:DNA-binding HxlR family transcriptional regulator
MRQTSFATMRCSLARSLEMIGDWWSPLILRDLSYGPRRFEELAEDLGISRTLLTARLQALEENGIVLRVAYQEHPPRYDYDLSEAGREVIPVLMALTAWGDRWTSPEGGPPIVYRHRDCQHMFEPTVFCPSCRTPVTMDDVDVIAGKGRVFGRGTALVMDFISRRLKTTEGEVRPPAQ